MSNNATTTLSTLSEEQHFSSMAGSLANKLLPLSTSLYSLSKKLVTNERDLEKLARQDEELRQEIVRQTEDPKVTEAKETNIKLIGSNAWTTNQFGGKSDTAAFKNGLMATLITAPTALKSVEAATQVAKQVAESTSKVAKRVLIAFVGFLIALLIAVIVFKSVAVKQRRDYLKRN